MDLVRVVQMSNKEYRGLDMPSYSLFKRLDEFGPRNFTKSFKVEGDSIDFGSYVDCVKFTPEEVEERFYFESIEKPTGQIQELADYIFYNKDPMLDLNIEDMCLIADELGLFGSIKDHSKRISKFNTLEYWNYLAALKASDGKIILSTAIKDEAIDAIEILNNHAKSRDIFYMSGNKEAINQLQLIGTVLGIEVKAMLDRVIIDHEAKTVTGYDLKCTEMRQIMFPYQFRKMRYYLQASLYNALLLLFTKQTYPEYTIEPFKFLVWSRSDKYPFVWKVSDSMLVNGWFGFTDERGKYNKGIKQLLREYKYYKDNDSFNIELEFIENNELEIV